MLSIAIFVVLGFMNLYFLLTKGSAILDIVLDKGEFAAKWTWAAAITVGLGLTFFGAMTVLCFTEAVYLFAR